MQELLPHILIDINENGQVNLIVEDYELFDFIDDYLTESCEISYESISSTKRVGGEIITITFPRFISSEEIEKSMLRLSPKQIEEIYLLNNKPD